MALFYQVFELVGLTELYYAGSHGMDILGPVNSTVSDGHPNCIKSTDQLVKKFRFFSLDFILLKIYFTIILLHH